MPNPSTLAMEECESHLVSGFVNSKEARLSLLIEKLVLDVSELKQRLDRIERKLIFDKPLKG